MRKMRKIKYCCDFLIFVFAFSLAFLIYSAASETSNVKVPQDVISEVFDQAQAEHALGNIQLQNSESSFHIDSSEYIVSYNVTTYDFKKSESISAKAFAAQSSIKPDIYIPIYSGEGEYLKVVGAFRIVYDKKADGYVTNYLPEISHSFLSGNEMSKISVVEIIESYKEIGVLKDGNYVVAQNIDYYDGFFGEPIIIVDTPETKVIDCYGIADGNISPVESAIYDLDEYYSLRSKVDFEQGFDFPIGQLGLTLIYVLGILLAIILLIVGGIYIVSRMIGKKLEHHRTRKF